MKFEVPEHIIDKEEIAAWIADQEEQAGLNAKIKQEAAARNDSAVGSSDAMEVAEEVAVADDVEVEVTPAPKKRATRTRKKK